MINLGQKEFELLGHNTTFLQITRQYDNTGTVLAILPGTGNTVLQHPNIFTRPP